MEFLILLALFSANPGYDFELVPVDPLEPFVSELSLNAAMVNPAVLICSRDGLDLCQTFWLTDSKLASLGLTRKTFGLHLLYVDFGAIEYQDETPDDDGGPFFRPYAFNFAVKKGFRIDDEFSVGVGINYFYEKILYDEAQNLTVDAGMLYRPQRLPFASFGLSVRHFGIKTGFREIDFKMPTEVRISGAAKFKRFSVSYEYRKVVTYSDNKKLWKGLGVEHAFKIAGYPIRDLKLFAAYFVGREIDPCLFGISYTFKSFVFSYAYRLTRLGFDDVHHVGLSYSFAP